MRVMDVFRERTMGELRAAEQEHRRAKAAHQEAERSWQSERRALKEQHAVNDLHSSYPAFQRLHVRAVAYYHRVLCLRRPNLDTASSRGVCARLHGGELRVGLLAIHCRAALGRRRYAHWKLI